MAHRFRPVVAVSPGSRHPGLARRQESWDEQGNGPAILLALVLSNVNGPASLHAYFQSLPRLEPWNCSKKNLGIEFHSNNYNVDIT